MNETSPKKEELARKKKIITIWFITTVVVIIMLVFWYFQNKIIFSKVKNTQLLQNQSQEIKEFKDVAQEMKEILSDLSSSMENIKDQPKAEALLDLGQKYQNGQISKEEFVSELKKHGFTQEEIEQIENELENSSSE